MDFRYHDLTRPDSEIRVAVLKPGSFHEEIRVKFIGRQLNESRPHYEALSYRWGSEDDPSCVQVKSEGQYAGTITITRNLHIALQHLRHKRRSRYVWIDALCINQKDEVERSIQVANMGLIFATADRVVSWLGPEDDNSDRAIKLLQEVRRNVEVDWDTLNIEPSRKSLKEWKQSYRLIDAAQINQRKQACQWGMSGTTIPWTANEAGWVCSLLQREYFERAWILQEVQVARNVLFQCGFATITEDDLWKSTYCLHLKAVNGSMARAISQSEWNRALAQVYLIGRTTSRQDELAYSELRHHMRTFMCKDPRDKVYAVLGLLNQRDRTLGVRPDYTREPKDVYLDIAQRVFTSTSNLELLRSCELSSKTLSIPSWVPDWSTPPKSVQHLHPNWSACAFISGQALIDTTGLLCKVSGVQVTNIEVVKHHSINEYSRNLNDLLPFLRDISPPLECLDAPGPTGSSFLDACCRVLAENRFSDTFLPHDTKFADFQHSRSVLKSIWSGSDASMGSQYLAEVFEKLIGRCFFRANDGYLGLAPIGTRVGDAVCVLLGSRHPVVLRPAGSIDGYSAWEVVGVCYTHGLMDGEAIYGNRHFVRYTAISRYDGEESQLVDGYSVALYEPSRQRLKTDPADLLKEAGIQVERYQRHPHELVVSPESLRAAGIPLKDFVLI